MFKVVRNVFRVSALAMFSLSASAAETSKDSTAAKKSEKQVQEARTLDGKKPKACAFKISLS